MRLSTKEELALTEAVREDMDNVGDALRDGNIPNLFRDLRPRAPPPRRPVRKRKPAPPEPEESKRARLMMQGTRAVRNLMQDRVQRTAQLQQRRTRQVRLGRRQRHQSAPPAAAASASAPAAPGEDEEERTLAAPALEDSRDVPKRRRQLALEDREPAASEHEEEQDEPAASEHEEHQAIEDVPAEPRAEEVPVPEIEDSEEDEEQQGQAPAAAAGPTEEEFQAELARQQSEAHRRMLLDDVPASLKRRLHQEDQEPAAPPGKRARVTESLVVQVMLGTLHTEDGRANEWVTQYELGLLRELTGLP